VKKAINILSIAGIVSAVTFILVLFLREAEAKPTFDEFPINQTRPIDFQMSRDVSETMTNREKLDQMRDWLLITVVSNSGLSPQAVNKTLFDLPPIRYGYMQPIANFEYEDTRSRYVGNGIVVALLPVCSSEDRVERLAHVADEHRKNTGEMPATFEIFDYKIDINDESAELTRRETLRGKELFTEKYGYVEKKINNIEDFKQFMEQAEDITFATTSGGLTLGGRRIKGCPYRGIRVEDVAAIWQSENKIQSQSNPAKKKLDEFNNRWDKKTYTTPVEKMTLEAQLKREKMQLKKELNQLQKEYKGKLADGSGFSLDPTFDFKGLKKFFDSEIAPRISPDGLSFPSFSYGDSSLDSRTVSNKDVSEALDRGDAEPLYDLLEEMSKKDADYASQLLQFLKYKYSFQEARYDGYIDGTEVGMVLFYTDLLAKLWALDYLNAIPNRYIDGFDSLTRMSVSPIYKKDVEELTNTRLWFGPQNKGFQVLDAGNSLTFAHNATRVYAASATSFQPGKESEANAASAAFLGWWNEHYDEIARYESQYQRLNEIMKWSLLISWLNNSQKGNLLGFLAGIEVYHENWFPSWVKQQNGLRFEEWGESCGDLFREKGYLSQSKVCFLSKGYKDSKYESLPLLSSNGYTQFGKVHHLSGGVSLAEKGLFTERVPLSSSTRVESLILRSNLKYEANLTGESITTLDGAKYDFRTVSFDTAEVTSTPNLGAKLRGTYSEMAPNLEFERTVAQQGTDFSLTTKAGGAELGSLEIKGTGNGFRVGWHSLDIDEAQVLARQMSRARVEPLAIIENNPGVESFIRLSDSEQYLVKFQGSDTWVKIELENPSVDATGYQWKSRTADLAPDSKSYRINWLKPDEIKFALGKDEFLVVHQKSAGVRMSLSESASNAPREPVEVQIDGVSVKGLKDPDTGDVQFACKDLPEGVRSHPDKLCKAFSTSPIHELQIAQTLRSGNYDGVVQDILKSPLDMSRMISKGFSEGIETGNRMLVNKQYPQALREFNQLIAAYGPRPELTLGKGLAQISERSPKVATTIEDAIRGGVRPGGTNFLDEINARLAGDAIASADKSISIVSDGRKISLNCKLSQFPSGKSVSPNSVPDGQFILFVQDSPELNNLNWDVSINRTIEEAVSFKIGELKLLDAVDLADVRPTMLSAPAKTSTVEQGLSETERVGFHAHYPARAIASSTNQKDDDDEKKKRKGMPIYVVVAKNASTSAR
jgi:hypothetical protein